MTSTMDISDIKKEPDLHNGLTTRTDYTTSCDSFESKVPHIDVNAIKQEVPDEEEISSSQNSISCEPTPQPSQGQIQVGSIDIHNAIKQEIQDKDGISSPQNSVSCVPTTQPGQAQTQVGLHNIHGSVASAENFLPVIRGNILVGFYNPQIKQLVNINPVAVAINQDGCQNGISIKDESQPNVNVQTTQGQQPNVNVQTTQQQQLNANVQTTHRQQPIIYVQTTHRPQLNANVQTTHRRQPITYVQTTQHQQPNANVQTTHRQQPNANIQTTQRQQPNANVQTTQRQQPNGNVQITHLPQHKVIILKKCQQQMLASPSITTGSGTPPLANSGVSTGTTSVKLLPISEPESYPKSTVKSEPISTVRPFIEDNALKTANRVSSLVSPSDNGNSEPASYPKSADESSIINKQLSLKEMLEIMESGHDLMKLIKPGTSNYIRAQKLCEAAKNHNVCGIHRGIPSEFYDSLICLHIPAIETVVLKTDIEDTLRQKECDIASDLQKSLSGECEADHNKGSPDGVDSQASVHKSMTSEIKIQNVFRIPVEHTTASNEQNITIPELPLHSEINTKDIQQDKVITSVGKTGSFNLASIWPTNKGCNLKNCSTPSYRRKLKSIANTCSNQSSTLNTVSCSSMARTKPVPLMNTLRRNTNIPIIGNDNEKTKTAVAGTSLSHCSSSLEKNSRIGNTRQTQLAGIASSTFMNTSYTNGKICGAQGNMATALTSSAKHNKRTSKQPPVKSKTVTKLSNVSSIESQSGKDTKCHTVHAGRTLGLQLNAADKLMNELGQYWEHHHPVISVDHSYAQMMLLPKWNLRLRNIKKFQTKIDHVCGVNREVRPVFYCYLCCYNSYTLNFMKQHLAVKHHEHSVSPDYPMSCSHCHIGFDEFSALEEHESEHLSGYPCYFCGCSTDSQRELLLHICNHHCELFACAKCPFKCLGKTNIIKHSSTCTFKPRSLVFMCIYCRIIIKNADQVCAHLKEHHLNQPVPNESEHCCYSCRHLFFDQNALKFHCERNSRQRIPQHHVNLPRLISMQGLLKGANTEPVSINENHFCSTNWIWWKYYIDCVIDDTREVVVINDLRVSYPYGNLISTCEVTVGVESLLDKLPEVIDELIIITYAAYPQIRQFSNLVLTQYLIDLVKSVSCSIGFQKVLLENSFQNKIKLCCVRPFYECSAEGSYQIRIKHMEREFPYHQILKRISINNSLDDIMPCLVPALIRLLFSEFKQLSHSHCLKSEDFWDMLITLSQTPLLKELLKCFNIANIPWNETVSSRIHSFLFKCLHRTIEFGEYNAIVYVATRSISRIRRSSSIAQFVSDIVFQAKVSGTMLIEQMFDLRYWTENYKMKHLSDLLIKSSQKMYCGLDSNDGISYFCEKVTLNNRASVTTKVLFSLPYDTGCEDVLLLYDFIETDMKNDCHLYIDGDETVHLNPNETQNDDIDSATNTSDCCVDFSLDRGHYENIILKYPVISESTSSNDSLPQLDAYKDSRTAYENLELLPKWTAHIIHYQNFYQEILNFIDGRKDCATFPSHCYLCADTVLDNEELYKHVVKMHVDPKHQIAFKGKYRCTHCFTEVSDLDALRSHEVEQHLSEFPCYFCGNSMHSLDELTRHISKAHSIVYLCVSCGEKCLGGEAYTKHRYEKEHFPKKIANAFRCLFCSLDFPSTALLGEHISKCYLYKSVPNKAECICFSCRHVFMNDQALNVHNLKQKAKNHTVGICKPKLDLTLISAISANIKSYNDRHISISKKDKVHLRKPDHLCRSVQYNDRVITYPYGDISSHFKRDTSIKVRISDVEMIMDKLMEFILKNYRVIIINNNVIFTKRLMDMIKMMYYRSEEFLKFQSSDILQKTVLVSSVESCESILGTEGRLNVGGNCIKFNLREIIEYCYLEEFPETVWSCIVDSLFKLISTEIPEISPYMYVRQSFWNIMLIVSRTPLFIDLLKSLKIFPARSLYSAKFSRRMITFFNGCKKGIDRSLRPDVWENVVKDICLASPQEEKKMDVSVIGSTSGKCTKINPKDSLEDGRTTSANLKVSARCEENGVDHPTCKKHFSNTVTDSGQDGNTNGSDAISFKRRASTLKSNNSDENSFSTSDLEDIHEGCCDVDLRKRYRRKKLTNENYFQCMKQSLLVKQIFDFKYWLSILGSEFHTRWTSENLFAEGLVPLQKPNSYNEPEKKRFKSTPVNKNVQIPNKCYNKSLDQRNGPTKRKTMMATEYLPTCVKRTRVVKCSVVVLERICSSTNCERCTIKEADVSKDASKDAFSNPSTILDEQ